MPLVEPGPTLDIDVMLQGPLPGAADYARRRIGSLAKFTHGRVDYARIRLTNRTHGHLPQPVLAQVNLGINGKRVRAQAEAGTAYEAIGELRGRLRRILERQARHRPSRGGFIHVAGDRLAGPPVPHRVTEVQSGTGHRITRRKSFGVARLSVAEAAEQLDLLDYHFHFFIEKSTGADSVLYRSGPTGYRLAQDHPAGSAPTNYLQGRVTVSMVGPPRLTVPQAVERLSALAVPFLFFVDVANDRGAVLYLRYDGDYGLLTPDV